MESTLSLAPLPLTNHVMMNLSGAYIVSSPNRNSRGYKYPQHIKVQYWGKEDLTLLKRLDIAKAKGKAPIEKKAIR